MTTSSRSHNGKLCYFVPEGQATARNKLGAGAGARRGWQKLSSGSSSRLNRLRRECGGFVVQARSVAGATARQPEADAEGDSRLPDDEQEALIYELALPHEEEEPRHCARRTCQPEAP